MYTDKKALRAFNEKNGTTYRFGDKPYECRVKTTRAARRKLTKKQTNLQTLRAKKIGYNFPQRVYAVRA